MRNFWKIYGYRAWRRRWPAQFDRRLIRLVAWFDVEFIDHGLLRPIWNRPVRFAPEAFRGNHPSQRQIKRLATNGLKTIVNLRGESTSGAWLFEKESCESAGVELIPYRMSSRGAPSAERVLGLAALIATVNKPVLFHCKSGADRSGFAAGVYLLLTEGGSLADAKAQLSWKYLHFKGASTGMLDEFFCEYERYLEKEQATHSPKVFLGWVQEVYDEQALQRKFKPDGLVTWVVDKVLRRE